LHFHYESSFVDLAFRFAMMKHEEKNSISEKKIGEKKIFEVKEC